MNLGGKQNLRVAIAGAGMVAQHHMAAWTSIPGVEVVAVCDRVPEKAEALAAKAAGVRSYDDLGSMLDEATPDALDIALPHGQHAMAVGLAAARGLAILCQKPLAPTLSEARAIVADLPEHTRLMVHENWRFRGPYRQLKIWIDEGGAGRPILFDLRVIGAGLVADATGKYPSLERQPFFKDLERFLVLEVLIHHFDTLRFLFGEVEILGATISNQSGAVRGEDTASILVRAGGVAGTISATLAAAGAAGSRGDDLAVHCTGGSFHLDGWRLTSSLKAYADQTWRYETAYQQSYTDACTHFVTCLRTGAAFETGPEQGLAALAAVERVYALAAGRA